MLSMELIATITLLVLMLLIFCGIHLINALMLSSVIGIFLTTGNINIAMNLLANTAWGAIRDYIFGVIPLFILMGLFANLSGASQELYDGARLVFKRIRGGVGVATVAANAVFSCITGVSVAAVTVFTKIAYPQMTRLGYDKRLTLGVISGSGVLGMLIPPSLMMIVYGVQAGESIGRLFLAGVIPGIVLAIFFCIVILLFGKVNPKAIPPAEPLTEEEKKGFWKVVLRPWPVGLLIALSLGGIWAGFFTPTEGAGVGALGALLLVFAKRKFTLRSFWDTLLSAGTTTGTVLFLLISAQMYSRSLAISGIVGHIQNIVLGLDIPVMVIILSFMVIFIFIALFIDSTSCLLLTIPLMAPIMRDLGVDLVWFGLCAIVAIQTGLITPPFGMNVFTVKAALHGLPGSESVVLSDIFAGSVPFFLAMLVLIALMLAFPPLVLFLPNLVSAALAGG